MLIYPSPGETANGARTIYGCDGTRRKGEDRGDEMGKYVVQKVVITLTDRHPTTTTTTAIVMRRLQLLLPLRLAVRLISLAVAIIVIAATATTATTMPRNLRFRAVAPATAPQDPQSLLSPSSSSSGLPTTTLSPSNTMSIPALAGDSLALTLEYASDHSMVNLAERPDLVLSAYCNQALGTLNVTMSAAAAADAATWELPLVIILQAASCGVLPMPDACMDDGTADAVAAGSANSDGCMGTPCATDDDCMGTLMCDDVGSVCVPQPDLVFFNVTEPFIAGPVPVPASPSNATVGFYGRPLNSTEVHSALTATLFQYTSISPTTTTEDPATSTTDGSGQLQIRRRQIAVGTNGNAPTLTCDVLKWGFVPNGFSCTGGPPRTATVSASVPINDTAVTLGLQLTTSASFTFSGGVNTASGTGIGLSWPSWTADATLSLTLSQIMPLKQTFSTTIPIPDLGVSTTGTWGTLAVGVYAVPSITLEASQLAATLSLPVTANFGPGNLGIGTGNYAPAPANPNAPPTVAVGTPSLSVSGALTATPELKLKVGATLDLAGLAGFIGSSHALQADLFAAARVAAQVAVGAAAAPACAAAAAASKSAVSAVGGQISAAYGYEVGAEWAFPAQLAALGVKTGGTFDFVGGPGAPNVLAMQCF
ncbi:hypothetical protein DFJ73DRAFT_784715 [Zopfochytrium polystomum]|nr:hypothetical protein DFJ73DRAFT_784715 [Zopfochytrium polystomum]